MVAGVVESEQVVFEERRGIEAADPAARAPGSRPLGVPVADREAADNSRGVDA
jgi:hypothetical protein